MVPEGSLVVIHSAPGDCPMLEVPPLAVVTDMAECLWILIAAASSPIKKVGSVVGPDPQIAMVHSEEHS